MQQVNSAFGQLFWPDCQTVLSVCNFVIYLLVGLKAQKGGLNKNILLKIMVFLK